MTFNTLGLNDALMRAVKDQGYEQPTAIQAEAIPQILSGRDVVATARTGTGKTAGFTLPVLHRLAKQQPQARGRKPRALVLSPTRELAAQVADCVRKYGRHLPLRSAVIYGGVKIGPQIKRLREGVDLVVTTPGRLLDHVNQGTIDLSSVECLVLDEADRMLDMGFVRDIRRIIGLLPKNRQTLMFSATFSNDIRQLADGMLRRPVTIETAPRNTTVENIRQVVYRTPKDGKRTLLANLIGSNNWFQVLVFTRTKRGADRLARQLDRGGLESTALHGDKSQGARSRALASFKSGKVRVLVATDVAARGLDIERLPHVVNFELPNVPEDYIHRIGRTGRAGLEGDAISLVSPDETGMLRDIEKLLRTKIRCEGGHQGDETENRAHRETPRTAKPRRASATQERKTKRGTKKVRNRTGVKPARGAGGQRKVAGHRSGGPRFHADRPQ